MQQNTNDKNYFNKLLQKIATDEKNAIEEFYYNYGQMIKAIVRSTLCNDDLVCEVINDVLLKVWMYARRNIYLDKPIGWLYTVTKNCALDKLKEQVIFSELYENIALTKCMDGVTTNDDFIKMIEFLNEDEKQIIIFKFVNDMTFKEISKELNQKISTVSSIYYRSLEKIRNNL